MITILMSTFNGEKYICNQLDSILAQTFVEWKLYVRDDGSTDNTLAIVRKYVEKDGRIVLLDTGDNLGACQSFNFLSQTVNDENQYIMYCDQDDIWFPDKIAVTFKRMKECENLNPYTLVYSTQKLVDEKGNELNTPIPNYDRKNFGLTHILQENPVYGCTMMINKSLLDRCLPIMKNAENHDYWIVLVAVSLGATISYIERPLMYYRQHRNNVSGSIKRSTFGGRLLRFLDSKKDREIFRKRNLMFSDFLLFSNNWLSNCDRVSIQKFIKYTDRGGLGAVFYLWRNGFKKEKLIQTIYFYLLMLKN